MHRLRRLGRGGRLLLALGVGGALFGIATAVQADIPDAGVIHGCYGKAGTPYQGDLRVIDTSQGGRCRSYENTLDWNQRGVIGPTGARGPTGPTGPQGPGATSFVTTVARGTSKTLQTLTNGVTVVGACGSDGSPFLALKTPSGANLQLGGTENETSVFPLDIVSGYSEYDIDNYPTTTNPVGFDGIVRDKSIGPVEHLDVHGNQGDPCPFWGMVTPSS